MSASPSPPPSSQEPGDNTVSGVWGARDMRPRTRLFWEALGRLVQEHQAPPEFYYACYLLYCHHIGCNCLGGDEAEDEHRLLPVMDRILRQASHANE